MSDKLFPKDFLWGASTAAYQVEGGNTNQWSIWEKRQATQLAATAEKRLSHIQRLIEPDRWDTVIAAATTPKNYNSGRGVEHFTHYEADFTIVTSLHMNAFRFGIEWSRLQPKEGAWNAAAVAHYHRYIASMKAHGIEPVLTIWHWTMPTWFTDKGGFGTRRNIAYFTDYVTRLIDEFGSEIDRIIILNEPNVYAALSYGLGSWPPQKKNPLVALVVYRNLLRAHKKAYMIIKRVNPDARVGIAMNVAKSYPTAPNNPLNRLAVSLRDYCWNWWFLNRIRGTLDFVGINFYAVGHYNWRLHDKSPKQPVSDLGWYMEPAALYDVLVAAAHRYNLPLLITENGLADATDHDRQWWISETITALKRALQDHLPIIGYLHWSLLDNFEWSYGWWPQFGLVHVDRTTMKRTVRPSAIWFGKQIRRYRS